MMVACGASSVAVACRLATPPDLSGSEGSCIPSPTPLLIDQLKQDLKLAADNNDETLGISICRKLEKLNLTKEQLEITRIGAVVNDIRKIVAKECPRLSVACRDLIKTWRKQTETYTRSGSSCGGSNGVTPSMVISPALKRLVTPQTPHRLADGVSKSQVSSPSVENVIPSTMSSGNLVAQAVEKVYNGLKRKNDAVLNKDEVSFKRSKSVLITTIASPQLSLSAVRRDAQSTAELVAQLSENLPTTLAPDLTSTKSSSLSPIIKMTRISASQPIIQEEKREKRKYTKRAAKFFKNASDSASDHSTNGVMTSELSLSKLKISKKPVLTQSTPARKIDWYASIPSLEELQKRAQEKIVAKSQNVNTKPFVENISGRELVCLPFVDVGIPDVVEYNYPAEENPKIECPYPRAARYALKGI